MPRSRFCWRPMLGAATLTALATTPAMAGVTDPVGDFLPSYAGPRNPDMDVVAADVTFDGSTFAFSGTMDGAIGTTPGALYVFGIDRGKGMQRFTTGTPSIGAGVSFDSVLILRPNGTGAFDDFIDNATTALASSVVTASGDTISASVPAALLPSEGLLPADYTFNLWPRYGLGQNVQVSDFAPDASNFRSTAVPEPATIALLLTGIGGLMARARPRWRILLARLARRAARSAALAG